MEELKTFTPNEYQVVHKVNVDFGYKSIPVPVYLVQFDRDIPVIEVTLHNFGKAYVVPDGAIVNIKFKKKDNTFVYKHADGFNEKKTAAYFVVDKQMTNISGKQIACIEVSYNGGVIATSYIFVTITENPIQQSDIESNNVFQDALELKELYEKSVEYFKSLLDYKMDKVGGTVDKDFKLDIPSFIVAVSNILRFNKLLIQNEGNKDEDKFEVDGNGNATAKSLTVGGNTSTKTLDVKDDVTVEQGNIEVKKGNIYLRNKDGADTGHGELTVEGKSTLNKLDVKKEATFNNKVDAKIGDTAVKINDKEVSFDSQGKVQLKHTFLKGQTQTEFKNVQLYVILDKYSTGANKTVEVEGTSFIFKGRITSKGINGTTNLNGIQIKASSNKKTFQIDNSNKLYISGLPFSCTIELKYVDSGKNERTISIFDEKTDKLIDSQTVTAVKEGNICSSKVTFTKVIPADTSIYLSTVSGSIFLIDIKFVQASSTPFNCIGIDENGNIIIDASNGLDTIIGLIGNAFLNGRRIATIDDITDLINGAPEDLDTLNELAEAFTNNKDVIDTLTEAIGKKADKTAIPTKLNQLQEDSTHRLITDEERNIWTHNKADLDTHGKILKEQLPDVAFSATDEPDKNGDYHTDLDAKQRISLGVPFNKEEEDLNTNNGMQLIAIESNIFISLTVDEPRFNAVFDSLRTVLPKEETKITYKIVAITTDTKSRIKDLEIEFVPGIDEGINNAVSSCSNYALAMNTGSLKSLFKNIFADITFNDAAVIGDTFSLVVKRQANKSTAYFFEAKGIPDESNPNSAQQASSSMYAFGNQRIKATYDGIEIFAPTKFEITTLENRLERKEVRIAKFTSKSALFNFIEKIVMQINGNDILTFNETKLILQYLKQISFKTNGTAGIEFNGDKVKFTGKTFTYNDKDIATIDDVVQRISALVNSSPSTLDTLKELANALGNDPNFATTIANEIGKKADKTEINLLQQNLQTTNTQLDKAKENISFTQDYVATIETQVTANTNNISSIYGLFDSYATKEIVDNIDLTVIDHELRIGGLETKTASALQSITATAGEHINEVGTPSVTAVTANNATKLIFNYLKGATGKDGTNGNNGVNGKNGVTFTPSVDESGNLSWTSSDPNVTPPSAVNIKGPKGDTGTIIATTYDNLKTLKTNDGLIPGQSYRITDYICKTTQIDTQSAGHVFDIIVTADNEFTLNENARACIHEGDTYFKNCKLESWKLKYSLDNDIERFAWADPVNGKGVIYYMKDEYGNECPYDFKNIQFKRYSCTLKDEYMSLFSNSIYSFFAFWGTSSYVPEIFTMDSTKSIWVYTFHDAIRNVDETVVGNNPQYCCNNVIKEYIVNSVIDDSGKTNSVIQLNNIVFYSKAYNEQNIDLIFGNTFNNNCFTMTFSKACNSNIFGNNCSDSIFGDGCRSNIFGNNCGLNVFHNDCYSNKFGNGCESNIFGSECTSNAFGNGCGYNKFGNGCYSNTFGNDCSSNTFGNNCYYNALNNNFYSNTFGNDCSYNIFGNGCQINILGNNCFGNSFGNDCYTNVLADNCDFNTFGNNCRSNTISNDCDSNTFGNECYYCNVTDWAAYNIFDNCIQYVSMTTLSTGSIADKLQNIHVNQGVQGTSDAIKVIEVERNAPAEINVVAAGNKTIEV